MSEPSAKNQSAVAYETWLQAELREIGVRLVKPPMPTPGGLAILVPDPQYDLFTKLGGSTEQRIWEVRGVLTKPAWPYKVPHFLKVAKAGLRMSTAGTGGTGAFVNFHFRSDDQGNVQEICARVEQATPVAALGWARQPLEELLDEICSFTFTAMAFTQFNVAVSSESEVLATETFLPFGPNLEVDGHTHLPPAREWLGVINELFREAVCANSPYYRLLVAFRVVDAISMLKRLILDACRKRNIGLSLPKNPRIRKSEVYDRGATIDPKLAKKGESLSLQELCETWRDKRNAIAHLIFERLERKRMLSLSNPVDYRDFACSAAILLFYSRQAYSELRAFLIDHIAPYPELVSVVPREVGTDAMESIEKMGVIGPVSTKFLEWSTRGTGT